MNELRCVLDYLFTMVFDENILQEKLIEAWKLRSDETSFSASLTPLVAECRSEEEFRLLFTSKYLLHLILRLQLLLLLLMII